ncbi:hypothetical protein TUM17386_28000 [Shewanella algae]|nr:hypothetical protein TUM17386_28000 [Shewanella algae]
MIALLEVADRPTGIRLIPGTGGTVTFRARDGEAELTRMYSQRVTGSPVRERTAGDGIHPSPEAQPILISDF